MFHVPVTHALPGWLHFTYGLSQLPPRRDHSPVQTILVSISTPQVFLGFQAHMLAQPGHCDWATKHPAPLH